LAPLCHHGRRGSGGAGRVGGRSIVVTTNPGCHAPRPPGCHRRFRLV